MKIGKKQLAVIAAIAAIAIITTYFIGSYVTGWFVTVNPNPTPTNYDALAKCLTQKGVVMYGLKTCPHCADQKAMFGDSFQYVTYVECSDQATLCQAKGIQFVPAWEIDGSISTGVKTLEELASAAGCPLE